MKYIAKIIYFLMVLYVCGACSKNDVPMYNSEHALFFEKWEMISPVARKRIDTVAYSFSHYVGKTELRHKFKVGLIGDLLEEDKEYKVAVVDTLTTASPDQYILPEHPVFHKGVASDSFAIVIKKTAALKDKEVVLTVCLQENDNFELGYQYCRMVKIRFNDKIVIPLWWNEEVEKGYLGAYSYKKLETIIAANPDFTTFEGLSGTEKRKIALNTKDYITKHGVTEENGKPMEIPVY